MSQPDYVSLNFILVGTAFQVVVERADASRLLGSHQSGQMPNTIGTHNLKCRPDTNTFSIRSASIDGMFIIEIQQQQAVMPGASSGIQYGPLGGTR